MALALLAAGCAVKARPPRRPLPEGGLRLGWRWVPGARMTFRTVVTREVGDETHVRAEAWSYLARDLDPSGVVHLEGRLVGFGGSVARGGVPVDEALLADAREEAQRGTTPQVRVDLRLSGRLVACSIEGFAASLPHRMLALHFPPDPVRLGEAWVDGGLARTFEPVLPIDVDVTVDATTTLQAVEPVGEGWRATLSHLTRLQAGSLGPAVEIVGTTTWDTDPGALRRRVVEARWRPDTGARVGTLRVVTERWDDR